MSHLQRNLRDKVMAKIHKFNTSETVDVLDLCDFIMGKIDYLKVEYCCDVSRYGTDLVMAKV